MTRVAPGIEAVWAALRRTEKGWTRMLTFISYIIPGLLCLAVFLYLNLALQPKWFPREVSGAHASAHGAAAAPISHGMLGFLLMALMFTGVFLIVMGCVEFGILTSRG